MLEAGDRQRLRAEPGQRRRIGVPAAEDHLQSDGAVESEVLRPVDDAHPAATEHAEDVVAGELRELARRQNFGTFRRRVPARATRIERFGFARPNARLIARRSVAGADARIERDIGLAFAAVDGGIGIGADRSRDRRSGFVGRIDHG